MKIEYELPSHLQHLLHTEFAKCFEQAVGAASLDSVSAVVRVVSATGSRTGMFYIFVVPSESREGIRAGQCYFTRSLPALTLTEFFEDYDGYRYEIDSLVGRFVADLTACNVVARSDVSESEFNNILNEFGLSLERVLQPPP